MYFRELPEGIVNLATPLLDLSNLFGVEEEEEIKLHADFEGKECEIFRPILRVGKVNF
jgi:hypothetical protein